MNPHHCPLFTTDFGMIRSFFESLTLDELIFQTEQIFNKLSSAEKTTYDINRYCSDYSDIDGRIAFIRALFDNAVFSSVHIPHSYQRNPRLIDLVRTKRYEYYIPIAREQAQEAAALTDDIDTAPVTTITVTNPRWNHVDEKRKEDSPAIAAVGDTIELLVDVTGYPEGAPVTFDIFDSSSDPAMRIETERGNNEGGTAKITWVVNDPNERGKDLKLEFEGSARSKSSGKAPIPLATSVYRVELTDDEGNKLEGVKVVFTVADEKAEVLSDKDGIAEHPAKDPAVKADVQVFWDGKVVTGATSASGGGSAASTANAYTVLIVDDEKKPIKDVKVEFSVPGEEPMVVETDTDGKAEHPAKDPSVAAEVRILWEDAGAEGAADNTAAPAMGGGGAEEAPAMVSPVGPPVPDSESVVPIAAGTAETETPEESTDGFTVLLVDDKDKPLKDVEVLFKIAGGEPISVVTDEMGEAKLSAKDVAGAEEAEVSLVWIE